MLSTVSVLLKDKANAPALSVRPSVSVADAVGVMNSHSMGAVLVAEGDTLVGIFTERDVMTRVVGRGCDPDSTSVSEVMSQPVCCVEAKGTIEQAMRLMSERGHRHLAVRDKDRVLGIISIKDVMGWALNSQAEQISSSIRAVKQLSMSNKRG
jgi:CBS domain-containing protein